MELRRYASAVEPRRAVRIAVLALIVLSVVEVGVSFATRDQTIGGVGGGVEVGDEVAPPSNGTTVITSRGFQGGVNRNMILAVGPEGKATYVDQSYHNYYDVDPSDRGKSTVLLLVQEEVTTGKCSEGLVERCLRNVVMYLNLSTGEENRVFSRLRPGGNPSDADWHDVDYLGDGRYLVGGIQQNRAFIYNATSGENEWGWDAQTDYSVEETGDEFGFNPNGWTHLNDVEYTPDGRVMLSLRNQDQVVFLRPGEGLLPEWSLGEPGNYGILFEQHNPDYIPASNGGPAVLVSDSENDRIVEYQRENGAWEQSWVWTDRQLEWPRDADRLPNDNTLITDTRGDRVVEVDENGDVVWQVNISHGYDAERIWTGDESENGTAAAAAGLESHYGEAGEEAASQTGEDGKSFTERLSGALDFVAPPWFDLLDYLALVASVLSLLALLVSELYFSSYRLQLPFTRK